MSEQNIFHQNDTLQHYNYQVDQLSDSSLLFF